MQLFESSFFAANRQKLLERTKAKLIVLSANGLMQRNADSNYPFRQESNFWYLTGIDEPDMVLVLTPGAQFVIMPQRHAHRDQWDGAIPLEGLKKLSGLDSFMDYEAGWEKLAKLIGKTKKVHTRVPIPPYVDILGLYTNPAPPKMVRELKKRGATELAGIREAMIEMRQVKQGPEISALKRAIEITTDTLEAVKAKLGTYGTEYELEADITAGFRSRGARGHAYTPIVAAGLNAATIHYTSNDSAINSGELVLLDVGAEYKNYGADITRTYAVGKPSARQRDIVAIVRDIQEQAISLLKPGIVMREYEGEVDKIVARHLKQLGLISSVADRDGIKKYYPHIASHYLGLDVHDAGDYDMPLQAGCVVTVEPGIYIAEERIGVRIEDDVLITEDGNEVLSGSLSRDM